MKKNHNTPSKQQLSPEGFADYYTNEHGASLHDHYARYYTKNQIVMHYAMLIEKYKFRSGSKEGEQLTANQTKIQWYRNAILILSRSENNIVFFKELSEGIKLLYKQNKES